MSENELINHTKNLAEANGKIEIFGVVLRDGLCPLFHENNNIPEFKDLKQAQDILYEEIVDIISNTEYKYLVNTEPEQLSNDFDDFAFGYITWEQLLEKYPPKEGK